MVCTASFYWIHGTELGAFRLAISLEATPAPASQDSGGLSPARQSEARGGRANLYALAEHPTEWGPSSLDPPPT